MATTSNRKLQFILGFAAFFTALWFLWDTSLVYPLKMFVVLLHELSHAIASVATGGGIDKITLDARQGGQCFCFGGNAFITLTAGYLGSLLWGAAMFSAARSEKVRTDWVNGFIGVMVVLLTLFFVRGGFGMMFGIAFGLTMFMAAKKMGPAMNRGLLFTLGLVSVLYAILDIKSDVLDRPGVESDAAMLSDLIHIPTFFIGLVWISIAIGVAFLLLKQAYKDA